MKNIFHIVFIFLFLNINARAQFREVLMIGPTLHFNFEKENFNISYGIECSYWNWKKFPYSVDAAIEYGKKKMRIYTEAQTGIGVLGVAWGPVLQYNFQSSEFKMGTQGSIWLSYFGGLNLRYRKIEQKKIFSPGIFVKVPFGYGINEHNNSENNQSDYFDWD